MPAAPQSVATSPLTSMVPAIAASPLCPNPSAATRPHPLMSQSSTITSVTPSPIRMP